MKTNFFITSYIVSIIFVLCCSSAIVGGFTWPYVINTWLVYFGKMPSVQFWHGALLGFCPGIGQLGLPAAGCTWIVKLFLI